MKKRIVLLIVCILLISQIVTLLVSIGSFQNAYQQSTTEALRGDIRAIELSITGQDVDYQKVADEYATAFSQELRVTFINSDGVVVADSEKNAVDLENHANREEVIEAEEGGFGTAVRSSESTGIETMYVAKVMSNGLVLRTAMPLNRAREFTYQSLPVSIIMFIVLTVIALVFASRFAKGILLPLRRVEESVHSYLDGETKEIIVESKYEELSEFAQIFQDLSARMNRYIKNAKQENKKSALILDNIKEGMLILDKDQDVLLINAAARQIFNVGEEIGNVNILHFVRKREVLKQLDESFNKRRNLTFDVQDDFSGKTFRYITSIVSEEAFNRSGDGMLVLITDVTELVKSEKVRKDFVANVSHELKTPLTSIDGYAQLISNNMVSSKEDVVKYANRITDESGRLMRLINDTLQLSELEQIAMDEALDNVDINKIAGEVKKLLEQKAAKKDVEITISGNAVLVANENRIKELVLNLCDNAIKYNKQGGKVDITLSKDEKNVYIEIADTGIGIEEDEISRVFERFYRATNAGGATVEGTGLGLAIAKHIAALYSGEIQINSVMGEGSTFTIRLSNGN